MLKFISITGLSVAFICGLLGCCTCILWAPWAAMVGIGLAATGLLQKEEPKRTPIYQYNR